MNSKKLIMTLAVACAAGGASAQNAPQLNANNIDEVVKAMTLDEKARFVVGTGMAGISLGDPVGPVIGETQAIVPGSAGTTWPIERLGIPAIVLADGPAGLRISPARDFYSKTYYCTHFPIGTALSSSWDVNLVEQVGKAMGNEVKEYGVDVLLAPANNIMRNPLCGRNFEYYSEDPVLSGNIAAAYVSGIQSNGVGTSLKHFAFNNQETERMGTDARLSQRAAREIYLKTFEIAVKKANPWTVMSSYNKVNGTMTSQSKDLLTTILRNEWGFKNAVMTDWFGGNDRPAQIAAGNDMIQPGMERDATAIKKAVEDGTLAETDLDKAVRNILNLIVKTPRFQGYKYSNDPDLKAHAEITRSSAAEGAVLLKNNGALPLGTSVKNVAVFGNTGYDIIAGGTGSGNVNRAYTISLIEGLRNNGYTSDKALLDKYKAHFDKFKREQANAPAVPSWGTTPRAEEMQLEAADIEAAAKSDDVAIIVIGRISGEGSDRNSKDFYLTDQEKQMISDVTAAFHKAGKKAVVLLNIGGVIETASWKDIPDAILLPWQGGQEGGNSMADLLSGRKNPSGKLPMTFPIDLADHYSSRNFVMDAQPSATMGMRLGNQERQERKNYEYTNYEEDIYVGYRYFDTFGVNVSYPFGYGLSYTTFGYSQPTATLDGDKVNVSVTVTNTGKTAGKEVVEVYVKAPKGKVEKPAQELKAFAKTRELKPGESQTLNMTVNVADLASFVTASSSWVVDAGTYTFMVGASSRDIKGQATVKVKGQKQAVNDVLKPQVKLNLLTQKK